MCRMAEAYRKKSNLSLSTEWYASAGAEEWRERNVQSESMKHELTCPPF